MEGSSLPGGPTGKEQSALGILPRKYWEHSRDISSKMFITALLQKLVRTGPCSRYGGQSLGWVYPPYLPGPGAAGGEVKRANF